MQSRSDGIQPATPAAFALSGVAIVTGASSGLGAYFCRVLTQNGMTVVAAARRGDRLDEVAHATPGVHGFVCDVTDDRQLHDLVASAREFGDLRVVINNAGTTDAVISAVDEDPGRFRNVIEVNLNATFVLASAAAREMIANGTSGSIINIASIHGLVAAFPNSQAGYVASKSAVIGLTRELAAQWAAHNIRVNAIAPGYFRTELTEEMFTSGDSGLRYIRRNTLLGRAGNLSELDGPLLLLASEAGSYITGQTITVDGGWTAR